MLKENSVLLFRGRESHGRYMTSLELERLLRLQHERVNVDASAIEAIRTLTY